MNQRVVFFGDKNQGMLHRKPGERLMQNVPGRTSSKDTSSRPSARVWPNREFGLGFCRDGLADLTDITNLPEDLEAARLTSCDLSLSYYREKFLQKAQAPSLDGCMESTHYGLKGITAHGKHMVRSGAYLLENRLMKGDVAFLTLTVPPLEREARAELARNWGKLTNRLVQQLSRCLKAAGRSPAIVGVTEIQSGRLKKYREGYLHLHIAHPKFQKGGNGLAVDLKEIRSWWKKAIERFASVDSIAEPICWAVTVEKSVEAYLGKYLSKGTGEELSGFVEDCGEESVPGQWWFVSSVMRSRIRELSFTGETVGELLVGMIAHHLENPDSGLFSYLRRVTSEPDGMGHTVGWYGRLTVEGHELINAVVEAWRENARGAGGNLSSS